MRACRHHGRRDPAADKTPPVKPIPPSHLFSYLTEDGNLIDQPPFALMARPHRTLVRLQALLDQGELLSLKTMAERLGVSKRQIRRLLTVLRENGIPVSSCRRHGQKVFFLPETHRQATLPEQSFTEEETLALAVAAEAARASRNSPAVWRDRRPRRSRTREPHRPGENGSRVEEAAAGRLQSPPFQVPTAFFDLFKTTLTFCKKCLFYSNKRDGR